LPRCVDGRGGGLGRHVPISGSEPTSRETSLALEARSAVLSVSFSAWSLILFLRYSLMRATASEVRNAPLKRSTAASGPRKADTGTATSTVTTAKASDGRAGRTVSVRTSRQDRAYLRRMSFGTMRASRPGKTNPAARNPRPNDDQDAGSAPGTVPELASSGPGERSENTSQPASTWTTCTEPW
jgi:hypothetical protein